jgi:hypothetical protein
LFVNKKGERFSGFAFKGESGHFLWQPYNRDVDIFDIDVVYWMPYPNPPMR